MADEAQRHRAAPNCRRSVIRGSCAALSRYGNGANTKLSTGAAGELWAAAPALRALATHSRAFLVLLLIRLPAVPAQSLPSRSLRRQGSSVLAMWSSPAATISEETWPPIGLASEFVPDQDEQGLDRSATPSLDEVVAVRDVQGAEPERWLSAVTPGEQLSALAPVPTGRGWPPYARGKSVLECVHVVLDEEWAHHGFCVRDLDLLGRPAPNAES